jgi:tetratricopeptide (TPR) repeat protein
MTREAVLATDFDIEATGCSLIESRLAQSSKVRMIKQLAGGYTDALVLLCDIAAEDGGANGNGLNGQYILKVERPASEDQAAAHEDFCRLLATFADKHVPRLVMSAQDGGVSADLYEVAGYSLGSLRSAELVDYEDREQVCGLAAADLLTAQLSANRVPDLEPRALQVLQEWLGPQFPENRRGNRVTEVASELKADGPVFHYDGELLPNPLAVFRAGSKLADIGLSCFRGPVHGDLHLRNILVRGSNLTRDLTYWLIDVSWRKPAPLLYDQAYLELSAFLHGMAGADSGRVLALLSKLDNVNLTVPATLGTSDRGVIELVSRIRAATDQVIKDLEPRRPDPLNRQKALARIAAGLNWAAKPLDDPRLRQAAFLWAAWATRLLLRNDPELAPHWEELAKRDPGAPRTVEAAATPVTTATALERWKPFQNRSAGVDLFLVADVVPPSAELGVLASVRWAGVVDLDPESDLTGLSHALLPTLQANRHVSQFGKNWQSTSAASSTNWLMANGWRSRDEEPARDAAAFRRGGYRPRIRQLVDEIADATSNRSAAVLCLRSGRNEELINYVVDYIDEHCHVDVQLDLASAPDATGFDLGSFLAAIAPSQPLSGAGRGPTIPGIDGPLPLSRADLHRLSVDLEVLHSEVLADESGSAPPADEFWRGRPPTWTELEACLDVPRDAHAYLVKDLRDRLRDFQLVVVGLDHSPGAGGSTLARRIAWDMHREHPTAVLRSYTPTTGERIDEIYQHTGRSVLVIAESADLPESDRNELVRQLVERNSRAIVLWVNRTNIRRRGKHQLIDPVSDSERGQFLEEYTRRAVTPEARRLLDVLVQGDVDSLPVQRLSPFYFGLCVYDSEFQGLTGYVDHHVSQLSAEQHRVARFLALVTRYTQQAGIPVDLVRRWLGEPTPESGDYGDAELRQILGDDLRHLVVSVEGGLRLLHPMVGDKVLTGAPGTERYSLAQVAVDFIKQVTEYLGPRNQSCRNLLAALFVRRSEWDERQRKENFAELIQAMDTHAGEWVFAELTTMCPDEPHFWNHRGRYHIYEVKGDYQQAEEFLQKAVEKSHNRDPLQLHTLGLVRRFWIENQLTRIAQEGEVSSPEEMLARIGPLFDKAMEAFASARTDAGNDYSWVTPVQLIFSVVEAMMGITKSANLPELLKRTGPATQWVARQLEEAEALLEGLRSNYAEARSSSPYYGRLTTRISRLYGEIDFLIEQWREVMASDEESTEVGLALARAIYARSGRNFAEMTDVDLRDIVAMTEGPVRAGQATDADLRLWFQAYRRLPEYSEGLAMERFGWFANEGPNLEANYYLYILHFLRWMRGDETSQERTRLYLEECRRLSKQNRRQWSFEWVGDDTRSHPLVHFSELGERRFDFDNFWSKPYLLGRVDGIIETIAGPQAGTVRISRGQLAAFFTPRQDFLQSKDINRQVQLYLGFSYEGLRAWGVTRVGEKPKSLLIVEETMRISGQRPAGDGRLERLPDSGTSPDVYDERSVSEDEEPVPAPVPRKPRRPAPTPVDLSRIRAVAAAMAGDDPSDYRAAIIELVLQAREAGVELKSLELGKALLDRFGETSYREFRGGTGKLRGAVERLGFTVVPGDGWFTVDLP